MVKLCPKVILEGTRLTHKTDIAFALNEHPQFVGPRQYRYHSPIISAEWCAFTNFPWGRSLINFEPSEEDLALETYRTWLRLFELQRYYSWIIDRFHISTQVYQRLTYGKQYDFTWLEERLVALNFRLIFCVRRPETFAVARTERLKVSGNPSQYDDLNVFINEQTLMNAIIEQSRLPHLKVDVSDDNIPTVCERIIAWLAETGGLTMPEGA